MSYLGKVALKASDIRRLDVTSSTSATHTLTWTPPNEQSLIITINGVKQQNNYSISGVTLTLDSALVATDEMEVIGINDIGTTTVPGDGTVTTAKIEDDAVTADKLANSINTEIAANTAKVTNATHTGDVTGATALTIANDAVDIAMLSATGTADATTFLRGDNAWAAAGGTNTPAFFASLTTSQTLSDNVATKITIDNERVASDDYDSSTNYRFTPTTAGTYYIFATCVVERTNWMYRGQIYIKKNGSSWVGNTGQGNSSYPIGKISPVAVAMDTANGTGDYYEVFYWADTYDGNDANCYGDNEAMVFTSFGAFKLLT